MDSAPRKGEQTRLAIIECALEMASLQGLGALTLGTLAEQMRMSKTGVFARVGSIQALQMDVLHAYRARFRDHVVDPASAAPAGVARLRAMFGYWARHVGAAQGSGCFYLSCASEFDDCPGPLRDAVLADVLEWRAALERCVQQAIDCGQLHASADTRQLVYEMAGLILVLHHDTRLLRAAHGAERSARAFERLLATFKGEVAAANAPVFTLRRTIHRL
jgi:AcrR family transcriptional regulator